VQKGVAGVSDDASAVTDTHALLFHAARSRRLGPRARLLFEKAEQRQGLIYVPAAVMWEVTLLARRNKVNLHRPVGDFFGDLFSNPSFQPHALDLAQVLQADDLNLRHDPFDALICAAALDLGLSLISRDVAIAESGLVRTIW
jgi:PIN domain nuclease of toxin-antitoxin system